MVFPPYKILQVKSLEVASLAPPTWPLLPLKPSSLLPLHFLSLKFPSLSFVCRNFEQKDSKRGSSYVLEVDALINVVANNCAFITASPPKEAPSCKALDALVKKNTLAIMLLEGGLSSWHHVPLAMVPGVIVAMHLPPSLVKNLMMALTLVTTSPRFYVPV